MAAPSSVDIKNLQGKWVMVSFSLLTKEIYTSARIVDHPRINLYPIHLTPSSLSKALAG
jgi:hypothetical protein